VRFIQACGGGNVRDKDHLEDLDIDGRIIFKNSIKRIGGLGLDWSGSG